MTEFSPFFNGMRKIGGELFVQEERRRRRPRKKKQKHMSIAAMVGLDVLCIILGLNIFAWFHHVRDYYFPPEAKPVELVIPDTPAPEATPKPTPQTQIDEPARTYSGTWGEKFADKFTEGEVIRTEDSYRSANVNVTLSHVEEKGLSYTVADIYISDIKYLRTAFGAKGYGSRSLTADLSASNNAVVAISGDYFSARKEGIVVRNGVLYRETRFDDVCILLSDGEMLTVPNSALDLDELKAAAPWQVWSFGPKLLDENGKALTKINHAVERKNPRAAIGYVEPGHYYFVQVDGRGAFGSRGMTLEELSALFESLGCVRAYNLDGGQTAGIAWGGELRSFAYGRSVSDIIYITDSPEETEG